MKVLLLSKYARLGASSRLRSLQYIPYLESTGIEVEVRPLFDDAYLRTLYAEGRRSLLEVGSRYLARIRDLVRGGDVDLIWLQHEAFPYVPFWFERIVFPAEIPLVVDYDDAIFHNYDLSENALLRMALARKIDGVMAKADTVIVGNAYLESRAREAGAERVAVIPTVVDGARYRPAAGRTNGPLVIGWIGSPSTQHYLTDLIPVFRAISAKYDVSIHLVGAERALGNSFRDLPVKILPWSEDREASLVAGFDIGIMPLSDGPWERGKCGYKLIQYMAVGKPVVASAVGANVEIVTYGACGELVSGPDDWIRALDRLLEDSELRDACGSSGRRAVEERYSLQAQASVLAEVLMSAARSRGNC